MISRTAETRSWVSYFIKLYLMVICLLLILKRRSVAARLPRLWSRIPPRVRHGCLSVVSVVFCQVEVSATSRSLTLRRPTECDASLCVI
jgi:hypothetical protein